MSVTRGGQHHEVIDIGVASFKAFSAVTMTTLMNF